MVCANFQKINNDTWKMLFGGKVVAKISRNGAIRATKGALTRTQKAHAIAFLEAE